MFILNNHIKPFEYLLLSAPANLLSTNNFTRLLFAKSPLINNVSISLSNTKKPSDLLNCCMRRPFGYKTCFYLFKVFDYDTRTRCSRKHPYLRKSLPTNRNSASRSPRYSVKHPVGSFYLLPLERSYCLSP
jgi:hypothetical protein